MYRASGQSVCCLSGDTWAEAGAGVGGQRISNTQQWVHSGHVASRAACLVTDGHKKCSPWQCLMPCYVISDVPGSALTLRHTKISTEARGVGSSGWIYYFLDNVCTEPGQGWATNKNSTWLMGIVRGREPILAILAIHRSNIWLRISGYCLLPGITQIRPLTSPTHHLLPESSLPGVVCYICCVLCKVL